MRYILAAILCIVFTVSFAQTNQVKYDSLWKKVIEIQKKKGLPQSALAIVDKIYALAKKEKQEAQLIKALVYRLELEEPGKEDAQQQAIAALEKETAAATGASRAILYSILAEKYWSYFAQNRWRFYNRTATINFKKDDLTTWSATDFHEKISSLFLKSLSEEKLLQQTNLTPYDPIIIKGNVRHLRPTLYDLLAHRALDYFRNDERDINKPAYAFEIKDPAYFTLADVFATFKIKTEDSTSLHYKALLLYQKLLLFHRNDMRWNAALDVDIERIQFIYQYGVMENKDSLYLNALEDLTVMYKNAYTKLPVIDQAWYLIAQWHADKAATYEPLKDTTYRYEYIIAKDICESVVAQKDSSEGKTNCYNLLNEIKRRKLTLTTEKVNVPGQPFRTLVTYRNFSKLYFRVISLNNELKERLDKLDNDEEWKFLTGIKPARSWQQSVPATNDYQEHSTEVKIDALTSGNYVLLASVDGNFTLNKNVLARQYFYVSTISYINDDDEYFILNRETGKPLAGATVQTWWNGYDYNSRSYKAIKGGKYTADKNGYIKLVDYSTIKNRPSNLQLEITYEQDKLFLDDEEYIPYYGNTDNNKITELNQQQFEKDNSNVFFFTDRSIYRPGQTIYFKGIAITKDAQTKKSKILTGYKTTIIFYNANNEKTDSLELTTSEFGSYAGKFQVPENVLNGQFTIRDNELRGQAYISVEEYKRPKFQVDYEPLKGTYKVNDSITVTGLAKAYAGNIIDGAQVKYRVVREARFIYPWLFWKWGSYPRSNSQEITNGVATTDADGKFTITFKAIPDLSVNRQLDPIFDYKLIADVTDINGETRSGTTTVSVSYKALVLKVGSDYGEKISIDSFKTISISTTNLNGAFEPALVKLSVYSLQVPDRLIRNRYWQQPDQFVMTYEEYVKNFPYDEYATERDYHSWQKGKAIWSTTDSSKPNSTFNIQNSKLSTGWYQAEAVTKDKYGQEVKDIFYFELYNERSETLSSQLYIWNDQKNNSVEPGEHTIITIGSSANDLFVVRQIAKQDTSTYNFISLNNRKASFDLKADEADRGGFTVTHFFVKHNRFYSAFNRVEVPWTNKDLTISYETYRDKTLPGSGEKWKMKISGYKKEKVAAEMLASMYDASLDQYKMYYWSKPPVWRASYINPRWEYTSNFSDIESEVKQEEYNSIYFPKEYDVLAVNSGYGIIVNTGYQNIKVERATGANLMIRGQATISNKANNKMLVIKDGMPIEMDESEYNQYADVTVLKDAAAASIWGARAGNGVVVINSAGGKKPAAEENIQVRKNFNETAFFFPDLKTDAAGNIEFSFTMPEALTKWKFQALAHTKDLAFGYSTKDIITQKELMVQPNAPRFLRQGDHIELTAKVVNMTDKEISGIIQLQLLDAATLQPVDNIFQNKNAKKQFTAKAGNSAPANFSIEIPTNYTSALVYRFTAKSGTISDGEEASLPVLTNRMLVTESMPLPMRGNTTKDFRFEKLLQSGKNETLQQHALTVEYTSNPAWYAVQALPYLMEYPYDCAEQTFNRFYANALATKIATATPKLKAIFEKWQTADTTALLSNLQKNQELKAVLLEETPWVLQAKTEAQQKKNIALLFNMLRMQKELSSSLDKLIQLQSSNGGFVWFKGGPDDRYITQYIVTGIGHLQKLDAMPDFAKDKIAAITKAAIPYLDARLKEDYDQLIKWKRKLSDNNLSYIQIQYLYMRSFFPQYAIPASLQSVVKYYRGQAKQYWLEQNKYMQGMIALSLYRNGDTKTPAGILASLKENAIVNEEMGMYWKQNSGGYYWHQAPVETQSLLIEAFAEVAKDNKVVDDLKTWLLKQKQTQNWRTTKATADACYALLLQGSNWLAGEQAVEITLGDTRIVSTEVNAEAGSGYFKTTFDEKSVTPSMGNISVKVSSSDNNTRPSWGAVYWQYFENLDKITPAATPLRLNKKLFIETNTDRGPVLQPVNEGDALKVGDKIKARIELRVDRDMEYVHMKDMRASCLEPVNVISSYKWQDGLGYYETTKDASTNFFFSWLPKGTYVFEYPLFVMASGNFSNGITTIQCMYAPEFSSHSEGVRIKVN